MHFNCIAVRYTSNKIMYYFMYLQNSGVHITKNIFWITFIFFGKHLMLTYIVYYLYVCNSKSKVRSFCIGYLVK